MNYQQRQRALSECIRERCERTTHSLEVVHMLNVDFVIEPFFKYDSCSFVTLLYA